MSDNFEMLVDADATMEEAADVSRTVLDEFRRRGLIAGSPTADCTLSEEGYRPGPAVPDLYVLEERECSFWELLTCGVEPEVGRGFNYWALGAVCEGFTCPLCAGEIEADDKDFGEPLMQAIDEWYQESGPALLQCPHCAKRISVTKWQCKPPLGFGNLSFRFWNWPPLDCSSWKINLPQLLRELTGHTIIETCGHI